MLTVVLLSIVVPGVGGAAYLILRGQLPKLASDVRGIALQTVIVMVVLLAIAGGVAAVLLSRGGEAITDIENQKIARQASDYTNKVLCDAAGFKWTVPQDMYDVASRHWSYRATPTRDACDWRTTVTWTC